MAYPDTFNAKLRVACSNLAIAWCADEAKSENEKAWAAQHLTALDNQLDMFLTVQVQAAGVSFESTDEEFNAAVATAVIDAYTVRTGNYSFRPPVFVESPYLITRYAFRERFTATEKATLYTVAKTNVAVQVYLDDVANCTFIDLQRPSTRAGVQALETAGILAAGRAATILDAPALAAEAYHG